MAFDEVVAMEGEDQLVKVRLVFVTLTKTKARFRLFSQLKVCGGMYSTPSAGKATGLPAVPLWIVTLAMKGLVSTVNVNVSRFRRSNAPLLVKANVAVSMFWRDSAGLVFTVNVNVSR